MKFGYSYKTSEGVRHEAVFEAKTKEDVFSSLRAQGIRPIKVWPIYSRFHVRKSTLIICLLLVALCVSVYFLLGFSNVRRSEDLLYSPRHQIYGDPARIEEIESDGYKSILPLQGDRFLAAYAIPGREIPQEYIRLNADMKLAIKKALDNNLEISNKDSREAKELKLIINGMKRELREYLADGSGTIDSYVMRLNERQDEEIRIYERVKSELETVTDPKIREERNASLRAMGLRTVPRSRRENIN